MTERLYILDPGEHEPLIPYGGRGWGQTPELYARKLAGELIAAGEPPELVEKWVRPEFLREATEFEERSYRVAYAARAEGLANGERHEPEPPAAA